MKTNRLVLLIILGALLVAGCTAIFLLIGETGYSMLNISILVLILLFGFIAIYREMKKTLEQREGLPAEDELSNFIKYKSGYRAYMASMYMWLFIFIFKDKFPDIETMLGGGILLSAVIFMIIRSTEKKKYLE
jgi:drug/metabolite transporter (DMT)-like permease